jgi:hypothetical protein
LKLVGEAFTRRDEQLGFQKLFPEQRYVTPDEVNAYKTKADQDLIDQYKDWKSKVDFEDPQFKDYEGPEFITNEEFFKHYFPNDPASQADFIRGGKDSPYMTPPESLGMKDWDTLMNEGVFSYDDVSFLTKVMPQRYLTADDIAKAKARLEEPPLAEKSGGEITMANGGAMRAPAKKTQGFVEGTSYGKSFKDRLRQAAPLSPLGVGLNAGYAGYKYLTGEDPLEDLRRKLDAKINPDTDTGSESDQQFEKLEKAHGGIAMAPGGLIKNLLKMTPKEEALAKLPQMKAELAAKQALEAEYQKAMRNVPYDKQVTLKDWQATRVLPAAERDANLAKMLEQSAIQNRLYHGTTDDVPRFDPNMAGKKTGNLTTSLGTFLSDNPAEASRYAEQWGTKGGNVMPVFAQLKNPYVMPYSEYNNLAMGAWNRRMKDLDYDPNQIIKFGDIEAQKRSSEALKKHEAEGLQDVIKRRNELIEQGHDSIIINIGGNREVIVFDPAKIKSATGNRGTYDTSDLDINKAKGGLTNLRKQYA